MTSLSGDFGFTYSWQRTATDAMHRTKPIRKCDIDILHQLAKERALELLNQGYCEGELYAEITTSRNGCRRVTYTGWWRRLLREEGVP